MTGGGVLRRHLFELATACCWMVVGLAYLVDGSSLLRSPVGRHVAPFDTAWSVFYVAAGPMIVAGILATSLRVRVAGLVLLATGLVMQGVAAATFAIEPRVANYFIFAVACVLRAVLCGRTGG